MRIVKTALNCRGIGNFHLRASKRTLLKGVGRETHFCCNAEIEKNSNKNNYNVKMTKIVIERIENERKIEMWKKNACPHVLTRSTSHAHAFLFFLPSRSFLLFSLLLFIRLRENSIAGYQPGGYVPVRVPESRRRMKKKK